MGTGARTALVTPVERHSRYLYLVALPEGHVANAVTKALVPVLATIPAACRATLTWDQGGEMAHHQHTARYFMPVAHSRVLATPNGDGWLEVSIASRATLPRFRPATLMGNGEYENGSRIVPVDDRVGKPVHQQSPARRPQTGEPTSSARG